MPAKQLSSPLGHGAEDASKLLECNRVFGWLVVGHDSGSSERSSQMSWLLLVLLLNESCQGDGGNKVNAGDMAGKQVVMPCLERALCKDK